ncbi:uncharacterized protein M6B38_389495 [Iris pallida]|nr:uncharacterized protein M6B38_389495 [Iris pallida]
MFSNTQSCLPAMGLMGMGMGMGMGTGIGMTAWEEFSAGAAQHPFMPLAYPPIPPIVGPSPAHLKLPLMPSLHSANFAIADQLRAQASIQLDPGLASVNMLGPNMMQISDFADPYRYYAGLTPPQIPSQIQARTGPGNSKEF